MQKTLRFSDGFVKNRTQMRAYFRDLYSKAELRTINLLLNVYEFGIPELLLISTGITQNQYNAFISKLEYEYGMTTESALEALNMWVDACISNGAGDHFSRALLLSKAPKATPIPVKDNDKPAFALDNNDTIYKDESFKVVFVRWERNGLYPQEQTKKEKP